MSTELLEKVDSILAKADMPDRHTFFQIEKFMIGKEPTGQAQLWQVVRELQARKETAESFEKDLRDAEDNLELFDVKIERLNRDIRRQAESNDPDMDLNIQECELNIRKLQREKEALVKSARKVNKKLKSLREEMEFLTRAYEKIVTVVGEMKPLDDPDAQQELWNEKLLEEFNLRIVLNRPMDPEFVRTVFCLHEDAEVRRGMTKLIERNQRNMIAEQVAQPKLPSVQPKARVTGK